MAVKIDMQFASVLHIRIKQVYRTLLGVGVIRLTLVAAVLFYAPYIFKKARTNLNPLLYDYNQKPDGRLQ